MQALVPPCAHLTEGTAGSRFERGTGVPRTWGHGGHGDTSRETQGYVTGQTRHTSREIRGYVTEDTGIRHRRHGDTSQKEAGNMGNVTGDTNERY